MSLFNGILYAAALSGLFLSYLKDKQKKKLALKKSLKAIENILPAMLVILLIIGMILAWISPEIISQLLGDSSGMFGGVLAAILGSITLIPGFIAFPLAASLLQLNAGYMQIAIFVSTLMMVGVVTFPIESKSFGRQFAIKRNVLAFLYAILAGIAVGMVMHVWG